MARRKNDPKAEVLHQRRCLHPRPEQVCDELFVSSDFFDPRDLLQVKYEMLRRVREGRSHHQPSGGQLWLVASVVLPGPSGFRSRRPTRLAAQKAGAAWCPQVVRGDRRGLAPNAGQGPQYQHHGIGRTGQDALRRPGPPAQHRTCPGTKEKKTPAVTAAPLQHTHDHATRYETLRVYVLQRRLLANRLGLAVLRLQGLAAWVVQWSKLPVPTPTHSAEISGPSVLSDDAHADVINVLAAMALGHLKEITA